MITRPRLLGVSTESVRPILATEWQAVRDLRLAALQDEIAHLAFLETHAEALARPESCWRERASSASINAGTQATARQFVAVTEGGHFVGTAVALLERVGAADVFGWEIARPAAQLVGVYVKPSHRGRGLIERLTQACSTWISGRGLTSVRLFVHSDNGRAQHVYERLGFTFTGMSVEGPQGTELEMEHEIGRLHDRPWTS